MEIYRAYKLCIKPTEAQAAAKGAVCETGVDLACVPENYQCEWYILSCYAQGTHKRLNIRYN